MTVKERAERALLEQNKRFREKKCLSDVLNDLLVQYADMYETPDMAITAHVRQYKSYPVEIQAKLDAFSADMIAKAPDKLKVCAMDWFKATTPYDRGLCTGRTVNTITPHTLGDFDQYMVDWGLGAVDYHFVAQHIIYRVANPS